ncbi:hypothetical protein GN244_ATG08160 [Phytophthora infestans]|uniref:Uncharacterized protein n=1 Tax=Phytophthora infestans TaxID=4787 RepID=A0A833WW09_PHYIN|nr:hypothetical protein GN244_ATG08160 [Phytophthora infestans]
MRATGPIVVRLSVRGKTSEDDIDFGEERQRRVAVCNVELGLCILATERRTPDAVGGSISRNLLTRSLPPNFKASQRCSHINPTEQ